MLHHPIRQIASENVKKKKNKYIDVKEELEQEGITDVGYSRNEPLTVSFQKESDPGYFLFFLRNRKIEEIVSI